MKDKYGKEQQKVIEKLEKALRNVRSSGDGRIYKKIPGRKWKVLGIWTDILNSRLDDLLE